MTFEGGPYASAEARHPLFGGLLSDLLPLNRGQSKHHEDDQPE